MCIESFEYSPYVDFYRTYTKLEGDSISSANIFMDMARNKGAEYYIQFMNDTSRFDLLDGVIVNSSSETLAHFPEIFSGSFVRSLSGTLYKQGYALSATLLRRCLVEFSLHSAHSAQSKYYSYAVSDLKKSIDYSVGVEDNAVFPDTQTYLS